METPPKSKNSSSTMKNEKARYRPLKIRVSRDPVWKSSSAKSQNPDLRKVVGRTSPTSEVEVVLSQTLEITLKDDNSEVNRRPKIHPLPRSPTQAGGRLSFSQKNVAHASHKRTASLLNVDELERNFGQMQYFKEKSPIRNTKPSSSISSETAGSPYREKKKGKETKSPTYVSFRELLMTRK
jgi:hypothetical protein